MRLRRTILAGAATALIAAPAAWYHGSPWWTLWRLREAARAGDPVRLASYVDYRAVAADMATDNQTAWSSILETVQPDTPGRRELIAHAKRRLARRFTEESVREQTLPWLSGIPIRILGTGGGDPRYQPYIVHHRLHSFEVRDRDARPVNGPVLFFRREGLGWKLEAVHLGQQ